MHIEALDIRRAGTAFVVVLLHASVMVLVLHATLTRTQDVHPAREILLRLLRLPQQKPKQRALPPPTVQLVTPGIPMLAPIAPPAATPNGSIEGLHRFLFDCTAENLGDLTAEQRVQCASRKPAPNPDETNRVLNLPSRAHDAPHWQRALAREQNPLLLPCANAIGLPLTPQAVICAAKGAIEGFGDFDEAPGYGDAPPLVAHVPNNGDPPGEAAHH